MRRIHISFSGIRALAVPFLLPVDGKANCGEKGLVHSLGCSRRREAPTDAHVPALAACQRVLAAAGPGVDRDGLADNETILHKLAHLLAWKEQKEVRRS